MEKSLLRGKEEKLQEEKQIDKNVGILHCTENCCCFGCLLSAMLGLLMTRWGVADAKEIIK